MSDLSGGGCRLQPSQGRPLPRGLRPSVRGLWEDHEVSFSIKRQNFTGILRRSGTYKAPERIRDYVDPSPSGCVDRGVGTRETYCVKTMGEMHRSVDI